MNCKNCGYELKENWNICPKCSKIIEEKNIVEYYETNENQKNDKIYLIIFLIGIICWIFIKKLSIIGFLISLISIVTGFIKCPKSKIIKVFFWLFLIGIAIFTVFVIFLAFTCFNNYRCP